MTKIRKIMYRNKRAIYALLVKLNEHISQQYGIPEIIDSVDGLQQRVRQSDPFTVLLTPVQTAKILGVSKKTLANWRVAGTNGLPHVSIGGRVRYDSLDVRNFITRSRRTSTSS